MDDEKMKEVVKMAYAEIASHGSGCCAPVLCCGSPEEAAERLGYSVKDIKSTPRSSNLGLGCGNPVASASLKEGEVVLDLGSGAGFDCFLAAQKVGEEGRVIGVDMTPEMVRRAKENAKKGGYKNVEFRLAEIESLPLEDSSVDVVISNCAINLSPSKPQVFREAFRVLKPGGRMIISDIVLEKDLPDEVKNDISAYVGCVAGAVLKEEYLKLIREAGFENVKVVNQTPFPVKFGDISVLSITVYGVKPDEG